MEFPDPVIRVAIEPKTKAGQEKMGIALAKLAEEDPTFKTYTDEETGQTIIAGMGELHLEIIVDRLLREFKVEANVGAAPGCLQGNHPQAWPMWITSMPVSPAVRASMVTLRSSVEPNESGKGYEFINAVVGGAIPKEYIPAVDAGIQGAMQSGVLAGYPVVDVKVTLYDGSYHEVDSSEMAFKIAGSMAFKEAMPQGCSPVILEPIMEVNVIVPEEYMGDRHRRHLNSRRGHIEGHGGRIRRHSTYPCFGSPVRDVWLLPPICEASTQGRGQYTMEPSHYVEAAQEHCRRRLISKRRNKD